MAHKNLDQFARDFIRHCLDDTIRSLPQYLPQKETSDATFSREEVEQLFKACAEQSIANFLYLFDQKAEQYSIVVHHEEGDANLFTESDGLVGELYGDQGWMARFSEEIKHER